MKQMLVFVSSTFSDMKKERDDLLNKTFKVLESTASEKGIHLAPIDLRWGIASTDDGVETIRRCLDLVGECKPYFLALVGGRYGWKPAKEHLDKLAPPFSLPPKDGTSVTELEILRFFERREREPEDPTGLFLFLKNADLESESDRPALEKLRGWIESEAANGHARCFDYEKSADGLKSMGQHVEEFFGERIDALAEEAEQNSEFPVSTLANIPAKIIRNSTQYTEAKKALNQGNIVVSVDSTESMLRTVFIQQLTTDCSFGQKTCLHLGAEGILSGKALKHRLETEIGPWKVNAGNLLLALDGLETLIDWEKSGDVDNLALSGVMKWIWDQAEMGTRFILGGDWSARKSWLDDFPCLITIHPSAEWLESAPNIQTYFQRNFAKELTKPQAHAIRNKVAIGNFSTSETLLLYDLIRRYGDLKPDNMTQDAFLEGLIVEKAPANSANLVKEVFDSLEEGHDNRIGAVRNALAMICASHHGVSLFDIRGAQPDGEKIDTHEWALMRSHLGPLLLGTIGRIRCADEQARLHIQDWLGEPDVRHGEKQLRDWIFQHAKEAANFQQLFDPSRTLAHDLRWLRPAPGSREFEGFMSEFFNPRIFAALAFHDWLVASDIVNTLVDPDVVPSPLRQDHESANPWHGIDDFSALRTAPQIAGNAPIAKLEFVLDRAELITNSPDLNTSGAMHVRIMACGIALRRTIAILMRTADKKAVGWALDWALELGCAQPAYADVVVERAWVEFALLLALWIKPQRSHDDHIMGQMLDWRRNTHRMPDEISSIFDEEPDVADIQEAPDTTTGAWQSRLTEYVRARKDLPSNQSDLMELFALLDEPESTHH